MAVPILDFGVVEIGRPKLGEKKPSLVKADVTFNLERYTDSIKQEWESLRPVRAFPLFPCEGMAEFTVIAISLFV